MQVKLNNKKVRAEEGQTILELCRKNKVKIPTLCYKEGFEPETRCRLCIVEADGRVVTSCNTLVKDEMIIKTNTEKIRNYRRLLTELTASEHQDCFTKVKNHELSKLIKDVGLREIRFNSRREKRRHTKDPVFINHKTCILCGRCVQACKKQDITALEFAFRGYHSMVTPYFEKRLSEIYCVYCGQCVLSCPTEALKEGSSIKDVEKALKSRKKVIVQTAPAVRASLGEMFGMKPGSLVTGKMVAALRKLGFNKIFDTSTGADFTTMEEAPELLERLKHGKKPMFSSCCPAWIKFAEHFYPELLGNISSCKSPHEMFGSILKNYYSRKVGIKRKNMIVVSVMPCTAKKFEITREGLKDIDYVWTIRELALMIKEKGINFKKLKDEKFDEPMGPGSGAGTIYGATSGMTESVLRTAYFLMKGKEIDKLEFKNIRGMEGIKKFDIALGDKKLRIAIVNGLGNATKIIQEIKKGAKYDFVEVMACPGGCSGGGGQPIPTNKEIIQARIKALYRQDKKLRIRRAHKNPVLQKIYKEVLGKPLSKKAHELLHTGYVKRGIF